MTVSLCGHDNRITGNRVRRNMSLSESRRQEVTEQMWYAAEDCDRSVQRRLEMLSRCRLRVGYGEQTVHETKRKRRRLRNSDSAGWWSTSASMTVPGHGDICKRPACNLCAMELSASVIGVGAARCDRTLMTPRRAVLPRSSLTASAVQGVGLMEQ